jgi:Family of unknown function (DUF6491)
MPQSSAVGLQAFLAPMLLILTLAPATAELAPAGQCFSTTEMGNWRAGDDRTLYIRVRLNQVYRIELRDRCPFLTAPGARLISTFRGSNLICSPLDWDLKVSSGIGGSIEPCLVKAMTRLSPEEIAALPKKAVP